MAPNEPPRDQPPNDPPPDDPQLDGQREHPSPLPFEAKANAARPCPICARPASPATAPFCSRRCADIDLHRWLAGVYAVPADEPATDDDEEA